MDLLHNFLTQKCKFDGQDFSFKTFRKEWKQHRMNYIFLTKHKSEPLPNFMNECNEYLTNCIYYNFVKKKFKNTDYQLSTYCIYILYVLITQQPCFEENSPPTYIVLPEYIWNSIKDLINFSLRNNNNNNNNLNLNTIDLINILKHMMKNDYFIYCLERPILYSTSKTDPYSKNGKIYCHGTRSRIHLTPTDLVSVMDLPMLSSHKNKFQNALAKCKVFGKDNDDTFIKKLREIRSNYQQKLVKTQENHVKN